MLLRLSLAILLLTVSLGPRARALDVSLELAELPSSTLRLAAFARSPTLAHSAPTSTSSAYEALLAAPASVQSAAAREGAQIPSATDRRLRRQTIWAGYGLAVGIGLIVAGVSVAAQTRPYNWEFSSGICYEDPAGERNFLVASTSVIAAGIGLSSGMLALLMRARRANSELRTSRRQRVGQALVGVASASVTTTLFMALSIGCSSS